MIAAWMSATDRKTPRSRRRLARVAKKPSTAASQDAHVGVKWNVQRGWRVSHRRTANSLADGDFPFDDVQEPDELVVVMTLHVVANHRAVEDVHGGEQGGRVVGHSTGKALLDRQAGLCSVERLDLALFVDAEDHGVRRRIDEEADDVAQLVDELRILGELELANGCGCNPCARQMRWTELTLTPAAAAMAAPVPMRGLARRRFKRQADDAHGHRGVELS